MLKSVKQGKFIIFQFQDRKEVKYDLSNGNVYGKSGKKVKDLCSQLQGYNIQEIINSFDDGYRNYLQFVYNKTAKTFSGRFFSSRVPKYSNIGTLLKKLCLYPKEEQYYITFNEKYVEERIIRKYRLNELPKGLLKLAQEYEFVITENMVSWYEKNPNYFKKITDFTFSGEIISYGFDDIVKYRGMNCPYTILSDLVETYGYDSSSLLKYVENLIRYESLDDFIFVIVELLDYNRMMKSMSNKYEKYPRYFLTTHRITSRNYNRLKQKFDEENFQKCIDKKLEFKYNDYRIIYPRCTSDIKQEAINLSHCVASYIDQIIEGKTHILFMRREEEIEQSLVTVEVRKGEVVQARGKYNRNLVGEENEIIEKYKKYLKKVEKENVTNK